MNRIYKVIYSKARQCAMVVSELAKSSHKNSRKGADHVGTPALARMVAAALAVGALTWGIVPGVSWAADTASGEGDGVAIGTGSNAPKAENVAIGKGATIKYSNGASKSTGDVAVGSGAVIDNYASQGGSIAIGKNATIENMTGIQESLFSLGQTKYHSGNFLGTVQIPDNPENVAGSIALGDNTYARTGSIMIGSHNYRGLIGDQTVDTSKTKDTSETKGYVKTKDYGININATTLGTNSFNQGAFSSVTGAYSIISGKYNGSGVSNYGAQNFGATITGSLNSIESATSSSIYSGIANSIVGTANKTSNSNGSLIFGAGNTITNSVTDITNAKDDILGKDVLDLSDTVSAKNLQDKLMTAVHDNKSGGATLVIGGGNVADYTRKTQILGVNNTVTGTEKNISDYNMIDGFGNTITGASHLYTIGDNNHITDTNRTIVFGDNRYVSTTNDSIIIGSLDKSDKPQYTTATDATIIGHNANAWGNRSMALGKDVYTTGDDSVAIGSAVAAYSKNSIAIGSSDGFYKTAVTDYSKDKPTEGGIAIGMGTLTNASYGTAIGYHAMVTNVDGYALGSQASVSTDKGVAIGYKATATVGENALALGTSATSSGRDNIAIGTKAQATSSGANEEGTGQRMALGAYSNASGQASSAIGSGVNVNGNYSVGIGSHDASSISASTNVAGNRAVGIGVQANVAGESAVGIGDTAIANGKQAVAIGKNANASNEDAFAFGTSANSSRQRALALGASANANHEDSVALGTSALAAGNNALALGTNANVSGDNGIAIGASVTEQNKNEKDEKQHVKSALAAGMNSTAIGTAASATGENSIVIGSYEMNQDGTVKNAQAVALDSMAFGTAANAWGQEGIAFGKDTGAGQYAVAIGSKANAWKNHSTAIGNSAVGGAEYGVAIGEGAIVTNRYKDDGSGKYVEDTEHPATDAVAIGHNALTNVKGGVALGAGSVSSLDNGVHGYDFLTKAASTSDDKAWKSSWAAVSIGDSTHTRQITNLAAGFNDTDAVNVAQLKAVAEKIGPAMNFVAGDGISIVKKDGVYTISANIKGGSTDTDDVKVEPEKPGEGENTSGSTTYTPVTPPANPGNSGNTENPGSTENPSNGKELVITADTKPTTFAADNKDVAAAVKPGKTLNINGDKKNITTTASDHGIAVSLNKDIKVDSVTAGGVTGVTINKDNKGTIGGLTNKTWDAKNITSGQAATEDQLQAATKNAVNYDGDSNSDNGKTITLREGTTIKNVANTAIEQNSKNAVNAGTVYNETRVKQNGTYVKVSNTAGENLSALDSQVTSNTQNINYLNGRVGELGDRINKVGAGAAALAALHPLDFDPDDKWDFAAGVGNYRNATAAAVGLFYRPNERTMFNLGWTMGDNRNMVNGGFSVKFGKSNKYVKYSKAEMASVIDNQSREIAELKAKDAQNAKDNAEMRAEIEALKKQVEALAAKK